jgi:hypothetical protein
MLLLDSHFRLNIAGFRGDDLQLQRGGSARQVAASTRRLRDAV